MSLRSRLAARARGRRTPDPDRPALTVVVAVRADRARHLDACLASLRDPGAPAQVLVVPCGDTPVAVPAPAALAAEGTRGITVLHAVRTLDEARAAGLAAADGDAIGFLAP